MRARREEFARLMPARAPCTVLLPVRYAAWLSGDLGRTIEGHVKTALKDVRGVETTRLPRGILVVAPELPGVLAEKCMRACDEVQAQVAVAYPVFSHEMGPVWTGVVSIVRDPPEVGA